LSGLASGTGPAVGAAGGQCLPQLRVLAGALFAGAPGARVSPALAARLGGQVSAGATARRARHRITFSGTSVRLTVLASPSGGPDETFRIAGMVDPTIVVKAHAHVSM
jgi:rusticyanin